METDRKRLEAEFERVVLLLSEGKGNKWLRNRMYDLAVQLEQAASVPELEVEAI